MSEVWLYIYDLSKGLAQALGPLLLGKHIGGVWHTGVVVYGKEIFFGSGGIEFCDPCGTILKNPDEKLLIGRTEINEDATMSYLLNLSSTFYGNQLCIFLCGSGIPNYISELPKEVSNTPFGQAIRPIIEGICNGIHAVQGHHGHSFSKPIHENIEFYVHPHAFEDLKFLFLPLFCDEPLDEHLLPERISSWWILHCLSRNIQNYEAFANQLTKISRIMNKVADTNINQIFPSDLQLLKKFTSYEACWAVCEIFRIGCFTYPELAKNILLENHLHLVNLLPQNVPKIELKVKKHSKLESLKFEASKCKLLTNIMGTTLKDRSECINCLPVPQIVDLAIELIEKHIMPSETFSSSLDSLLEIQKFDYITISELKQAIFSMCHNLSLFNELLEEDAMKMGLFLIHYTQTQTYPNAHDSEYLMRILYIISLRFSVVADFARSSNLLNNLISLHDRSVCSENEDLAYPQFLKNFIGLLNH